MGRDELNLVDFPIGVLKYQQPTDADGRRLEQLVFSVDSMDEEAGTIIPKQVTIRTSSKHGFPTPKEDELLIGLMQYCRRKNNFTAAKTKFQISEMLRVLGWADNGRSRRQLREGLDRLAGVQLTFENSWRSSDGKEFEREFVTGILDGYELRVAKDGDSDSRELTAIQWSAEVFADIQRGNVKELNTGEYYSLKLPLSRRLYRYLDKHLDSGKLFEMNLLRFAAHLGITEKSHIGKIRERLKKPLSELEELGTLFQLALDADRYHRLGDGDWLIRFLRVESGQPAKTDSQPTTTQRAAGQQPNPSKKKPPKSNPAATELICEFYRLWSDDAQHQPSFHECQQAKTINQQYGEAKALELLPAVIKLMKERFPNATAFGATKTYWALANQKGTARVVQAAKQQKQSSQQTRDDGRRQLDRHRKQQLQDKWNRLDETKQQIIRREVLQGCTDFVRRKIERREFDDSLVMIECLNCLDEQQKSAVTE